nr:ArsC/Spx/MgsR family protein [uncultured Carboxylicivirga sp.]
MEVHFYEKPGCINNTKQKILLKDKGYKVIAYNILKESWTKERLELFIKERPLIECFNSSAPRIKSGDVNPQVLSYDETIAAMLDDPYLIKRPLIRVGNNYGCGFDSELAKELMNDVIDAALLSCPKTSDQPNCDEKVK